MRTRYAAAAAALLLACGSAQAITLFSDDFEADTAQLNQDSFVNGWVVTDGTVDVVNNFGGIAGKTVDLDGSTGDAGIFTKTLVLQGGVGYLLSFDLYGSRRGSAEEVIVSFGSTAASLPVASDESTNQGIFFLAPATGNYNIAFRNLGGDNVGALLDNVVVSYDDLPPIPEPATTALMLAGLAGMGAWAQRRRKSQD